MKNKTSRWTTLVQMYLCLMVCVIAMQCIPPVLPLLLKEFHLTYHQGGLLMSMFCLPAVVLSVPIGLLADRHGIKLVGGAGLLFALTGALLVAIAHTFTALVIGRVVTGIGCITLLVVTPQGIAERFRGREMGVAMGVFNTTGPVAILISFNALAVVGMHWGWRSAVWTSALLIGLVLLGFLLFYSQDRRPSARTGIAKPTAAGAGWIRGSSALWLIAASWAFFNASFNSFFSFTPDFLASRGFSLASAGFHTSIVVASSLVFSPVMGYVTDKTRHKPLLIVAAGILMAAALLMVPGSSRFLVVTMVALGLATAVIPTPTYSIAAELISPERFGLVFGILSMLNNFGVFVGPQAVGLSRDVSGSYTLGFVLMALMAFFVAVLAGLTMGRKDADGEAGVDEAPMKKTGRID